ncbi:MAG: glycosyltransferase [Gemmatimonadaceae bacterium]|nr:glycosyltransferase [Gemmatimonadaceae bacterium]
MLDALRPADIVVLLLSLPLLAATGYLVLLTICSARILPLPADETTRFDIVVPAHNEASGIGATVASLRQMTYPADRFRILVVADNCTDDTAQRARDAGAQVLERTHGTERGKGYALAHAYAQSLSDGFAQMVVVVDADTSVSRNLLTAFSARAVRGAQAVQAEYGVRNANASWRTRLMVLALTMFHTVRSLGRERLGLSCGLRGNGMGFSSDLLRRVPPRAFSIVEDVEYGVALGLAYTRVEYVHDAEVRGDMPVTEAASRTQRERWEGGRLALITSLVPPLLRASFHRAGAIPLDLALDLLVPPLTLLAGGVVLGAVVAGTGLLVGWLSFAAAVPMLLCVAFLAAYVLRGAALSGGGVRVIGDLAWAPVYAVWKVSVLFRPRRRDGEWVRTARSDEIVP